MKLGKPFLTVQCPGSYAKTLEVVEYIGLNTLQTGLGGFDAVSVNTKGQVFGLDETVVASDQLILQHRGIFLTDTVKGIPLGRDGNGVAFPGQRPCLVFFQKSLHPFSNSYRIYNAANQ